MNEWNEMNWNDMTSEGMNECMNDCMTRWLSHWLHEMIEWMNEWMTEDVQWDGMDWSGKQDEMSLVNACESAWLVD